MSKIVDIFEYVMQMEKDGENYYHQLAQQITNKGLQTTLIMLADDEVKGLQRHRENENRQATVNCLDMWTKSWI